MNQDYGPTLIGGEVSVSSSSSARRLQSNQRRLTPIFVYGKTRVYFERVWREAST